MILSAIAPATVHQVIKKEGILHIHYNKIKPILSKKNKLSCIQYCLNKCNISTGLTTNKPLKNHIHLDEKWFFLTQQPLKCYLLNAKDLPLQDKWFDGKIGCYAMAEEQTAKGRSKHYKASTLKNVNLTKDLYKMYLKKLSFPSSPVGFVGMTPPAAWK